MSAVQDQPTEESILVVDDTPNNLHLLAVILSKHGYKMRFSPSGELALTSIQFKQPDLILLDIMMPGLDGYAVCQQLKADESTRDIPVIFMSALEQPLDKVKAFALGGVDYITKPFQMEEVIARIDNQMRLRRLQKQLTERNDQLQQEIHDRDRALQELKQTQAALSQEKALLRCLIDSIPDCIFYKDLNGVYLTCNKAFEALVGHATDALIGSCDQDLFVNQVPEFVRQDQAAMIQGQPQRQEAWVTYPNGAQCLLDTLKTPLLSADREVLGVIGIGRDITDRKRQEQALAKRQCYLTALVEVQRQLLTSGSDHHFYLEILKLLGQTAEASRVYLFENHWDAAGNLCTSQRAEWCASGIPAQRDNPLLQNLSYAECFPDWHAKLAAGEIINQVVADLPAAQRAILEPQNVLSILILPLIVNHHFWGLIGFDNCLEARIWNLSEVSLLGAAASAISLHRERKLVEDALRESADRERATLRVVERMRQTLNIEQIFSTTTEELRHILKCDRVVIYRFNPDWSGEFVSESVGEEWTPILDKQNGDPKLQQNIQAGLTRNLARVRLTDTYLQQTQAEVLFHQPSFVVENVQQAKFSACYLEMLQEYEVQAYVITPIFQSNQLWGMLAAYQHSGARQWKPNEVNLVLHVSNQLGIALHQAELFVQLQKQSIELEKARDAAEAANRAKSEFLANMSHELRTPLNAILGFTQIMSHDAALNPTHQEHLSIINRSGQHLLELINDVLEMSKIEAGRAKLNSTSFDLHHLLNNLEKMLSLKAVAKQLLLTFEQAADVPQYITTDEGKLRQVLLNLVGNAIKFTAQGKVTLRVQLGDRATGGSQVNLSVYPLLFEVEDTGPGIAWDEMQKLFQPFEQTQLGQQSSEGTGLGLAISQRFVSLMGGEMAVESVVGQGSIFRFSIQVCLVQPIELPTQFLKRRVLRLAPDQPTYRLLIVENQWENRQFLLELLAPLGFEVYGAENGQAGVLAWERYAPDLILMDMQMPIMDGYEATRQIKTQAREQSPVIIAVTSSAFEEEQATILAMGCDDFIRKPVQEEILLTKLADHLGVHYLYEAGEQETLEMESSAAFSLDAVALQIMPPEWIAQLHKAAIGCSDRQVGSLITQIPAPHTDLAQALARLAYNFQFDEIVQMCVKCSEEAAP